MTRHLTVSETADQFHVTTRAIVRWCEEGRLPHSLTLGGHRRFDPDAIAAIAASLDRPVREGAA